MAILCVVCSDPIPPERLHKRAKYCGSPCERAFWSKRYRQNNPKKPYSTGTAGAICELLVSADLLGRGYEVFRAVSQSCSCDLAILKNGKVLRVEVRTGYRSGTGKIYFPNRGQDKADIFAVVVGDSIHYIPEM